MTHPPHEDPARRSFTNEHLTEWLERLGVSIDGLTVLTRAGLRKALLIMGVFVGLLCLVTIVNVWTLIRSYGQTERMEAIATQLEEVVQGQAQARAKVEEVREKVDTAAQAAESKPSIEIAADSKPSPKTGERKAVILIHQKPKHVTGSPVPPVVEIPVKLPPEATAVPTSSANAPPSVRGKP